MPSTTRRKLAASNRIPARPPKAPAAAGALPRAATAAASAGNAAAAPESRSPLEAARSTDSAWALVFGAWLVAAASVLGALFFSEVMSLPPCVLCWYQRIFVFPLALLLPFGLFPFDARIVRYALPLAIGGWLVALFHLLLVAGVVPASLAPCTQGVPCTDVPIEWLGFVTIPLLSLVAFSLVGALLLLARARIPK